MGLLQLQQPGPHYPPPTKHNDKHNDKQNKHKHNQHNSDSDYGGGACDSQWDLPCCVWSYLALWTTVVTHRYDGHCTVGYSRRGTCGTTAMQAMNDAGASWDTVRATLCAGGACYNGVDYDVKIPKQAFIYPQQQDDHLFKVMWHNARGLEVNRTPILDRQVDLQLLSECSVSEHLVNQVITDCSKNGKRCMVAPTSDLAKEAGKRRGRKVAALLNEQKHGCDSSPTVQRFYIPQ